MGGACKNGGSRYRAGSEKGLHFVASLDAGHLVSMENPVDRSTRSDDEKREMRRVATKAKKVLMQQVLWPKKVQDKFVTSKKV